MLKSERLIIISLFETFIMKWVYPKRCTSFCAINIKTKTYCTRNNCIELEAVLALLNQHDYSYHTIYNIVRVWGTVRLLIEYNGL